MDKRMAHVTRTGRIYHFRIGDVDYRAFIWNAGSSFCGRVEDHPEVPQCRGRTALAVRTMLSSALVALQPN